MKTHIDMRSIKTLFKIKYITILILLMFAFWSFYQINNLNYKKHKQIEASIVNHPENLPETQLAEITSVWFKNLKADWYWLKAVQYIGSNALASEYKKYLFEVLDLITDLNPYFEKPYIVGQLLIPSYNFRYETLSDEQQENYIDQWISLGLKWVANFCDNEKINRITAEDDLTKIWKDEKYKDPCKSYAPAYYLAYIYHFYRSDSLSASKYYKIAAANADSPEWAKTLAAIMQWKWWSRDKSTLMFLWLAKDIETSDQVCTTFATEMEKFYKTILSENIALNASIVSTLENTRNDIFWEFSEEREQELFWDTKCESFVNKAIREINLSYIEQENVSFKRDHNGASARNAKALFDSWYMDFLPTDIQQYWEYGIIYEYDPKKWGYDYLMWSYD